MATVLDSTGLGSENSQSEVMEEENPRGRGRVQHAFRLGRSPHCAKDARDTGDCRGTRRQLRSSVESVEMEMETLGSITAEPQMTLLLSAGPLPSDPFYSPENGSSPQLSYMPSSKYRNKNSNPGSLDSKEQKEGI